VVIIPRPVRVVAADGEFVLRGDTGVVAPPELARIGGLLGRADGGGSGPSIALAVSPDLAAEEYRLTVRADGVRIEGGDPAGVFYGVQTFRQLLPAATFRQARIDDRPAVVAARTIEDRPRFGWRGCMIDVARHFVPKQDLLRYVDLLAMHKFNVLHLHLTDDQGWRLEIERFPRLTEVGGWRTESMVGPHQHGRYDGRPHGGFYTQDDIREIVAYAADRFVTVVPEIDLPGHSQAAIAAYPELGNLDRPLRVATRWGVNENVLNVEESTIAFYQAVFDEVMELFPSRYVGVGGDECPKRQWRESPRAQERMAELGLRDEDELQSWFIGRIGDHLTSHGRKLYGWDEILLGGAPPGATVAGWLGRHGAIAAARAGHDVVACPFTDLYLDFRQSDHPDEPIPVGNVTTLEDVYAFEPVPAELTAAEAGRVIGVQANLWTEHIDSVRSLDYMAFPRLVAAAEIAWSSPDRDLADFLRRLEHHEERLAALGVDYRRRSGLLPWQTRPGVLGRPRSRGDVEADVAVWAAGFRVDWATADPRDHL
jgi:hexosaminidase